MITKSENWQWLILISATAIFFFIGVQYGKYSMTADKPQVVTASEQKTEEYSESTNIEEESEVIKVHVAGAIFNSGLYEFKAGSRVDDAIKKAIPLPEADLDRLNLASLLHDGERIYIPFKGEGNNISLDTELYSENIAGKININSSSEKDLEELPGIGPTLAARIIEYRNKNGAFSSVEQLKNVSGIGEKKFESIRELVTVY